MSEFDTIVAIFAFVVNVIVLTVAVVGSHFMLRARIMVAEEKINGWSKAFERFDAKLDRIEEKLDHKADR